MKVGVARMLVSAVPRSAFQPLASSCEEDVDHARDVRRRLRDGEADRAVLGEAVVLPPQLLQLLGAERVAQQFVRVARRIETGALFGAQHVRRKARLGERGA